MRHWAEGVAREHLARRGLDPLAENVVLAGGEIDLVMRDGEVTVFVEVRQRRDDRFGSAAASLDGRKRARVRRAALAYLARVHGRDDLPVRFDAVLVTGGPDRYRLDHLEDAF